MLEKPVVRSEPTSRDHRVSIWTSRRFSLGSYSLKIEPQLRIFLAYLMLRENPEIRSTTVDRNESVRLDEISGKNLPSKRFAEYRRQHHGEGDCGCVPVVDSANKLVGIITDRDICMAAYTQRESLHRMRVENAMARPVGHCAPEDDLQIAEQFMCDGKLRRLPVSDPEGRVVGIRSLSDIAIEAQRERAAGTQASPACDPARILSAVCEPRHAAAQFGFAPEAGELDRPPKPPKKSLVQVIECELLACARAAPLARNRQSLP